MKNKLLLIISGQKKDFLSLMIKGFLYFLSLIYSSLLGVRFILNKGGFLKGKSHRIKIVSVGNITLGGTGKTPMVAKITEYLLKNKKNVAIVSRGYKSFYSKYGVIADEPQMLKTMYPEAQVIINKNRNDAIKLVVEEMNSDIVILDDAFQNLKVKKDLDVVCINCFNPFGYGYVLPRGIMRLPFCYLENADIFMLTNVDNTKNNIDNIIQVLKRYNKKALICKSMHKPEYLYDISNKKQYDLNHIKNKRVAVLCAIVNPELFEKTVKSLKAEIVSKAFFDDHYFFKSSDIDNLLSSCVENKAECIITTAKDEPRLKIALNNKNINLKVFVLKINIEVQDNEREFFNRISSLFTN